MSVKDEIFLMELRKDEYVKIGNILKRFSEIDEEYGHSPWTLEQIYANINILGSEELKTDNCIEKSSSDYILLIESCLRKLKAEYERLYWNKNQSEPDSPFDNTGAVYSNDTFSVKAYDWSEKGNADPNFEYEGLKVWWYKYCTRGLTYKGIVTADFLQKMLKDCIESMRKDFEKGENK